MQYAIPAALVFKVFIMPFPLEKHLGVSIAIAGCDELKTCAEQHYLAPADIKLRVLHL
jgi:hypothetical protein